MRIMTLTRKGQVTIPRAVRRALGLQPGDHVLITLEGDRALLIPARRHSLTQLQGALPATVPFPGHQQIREEVRRQRAEALLQESRE